MKIRTGMVAGLIATAFALPAVAAPTGVSAAAEPVRVSASAGESQGPHASVSLRVARTKSWVGQAVPVTLTAYFRRVESVTLLAPPRIDSKGIITSELSEEPTQSVQTIGGEPVLVVQWKGTLTPSAPGPVDLSVTLDARLQYRSVVRRAAPQPDLDDEFFSGFGFGSDPFDTGSIFQQMRQQMQQMEHMMVESLGPVRAQDVKLKATAPAIDVQPLPSAGQPADFNGAVGRFELDASVASARGKVDEPLTLRVTVTGTGDLDRVVLGGVQGSDVWKAYPPKVIVDSGDPGAKQKPTQKVFEQVLVPQQGGELRIPPVSLSAFDPKAEQYTTYHTEPLTIHVEGTRSAAPPPVPADTKAGKATTAVSGGKRPAAIANSSAAALASLRAAARSVAALVSQAWVWGTAGVVLLVLLLGWTIERLLRRNRRERALQRRMRRAASGGKVDAFYSAGRRLVEVHLAKAWGLGAEQITAREVRARLGQEGEPLAKFLSEDEALRFGRGSRRPEGLMEICATVEGALSRAA